MERNQNGRKYPSMEEAKAALAEAALRNPGNWFPHSEYTAKACKAIAERCENLDAEKAFVLGYCMTSVGTLVVKEKHQLPDTSIAWNVDGRCCPNLSYS